MKYKYKVVIEQDEDGKFVAEVPTLPGCISQGSTRDEALENIRQAIEVYLESVRLHGEPLPQPRGEPRQLGWLKGKLQIPPGFDAPLPDEVIVDFEDAGDAPSR